MGCDATALLVYGIKLGGAEWNQTDRDLESEWRHAKGPPEPEDTGNYKSPEWDAWRVKLRDYEKSPRAVGVVVYCCDDQMRHCACAKALTIRAEWDETATITQQTLDRATSEHRRAISEFCEMFNIPESEPAWLMLARYL